ncbi:hypothetical protein D3C85_728270 [compost metagenome]
MAKISVTLWDPRRETDGARPKIHEEPHVTDTNGKTKSRLRDRRKRKESQDMVDANVEKLPGEVHVSKVNWKGRRERGIDAY